MNDASDPDVRITRPPRRLGGSFVMIKPDALSLLKSDAEWGRVLWGWLREMLPDAGCCVEFDCEDLMQLAQKHGRAKKVIYDPDKHGEIEAEPGGEIWWWGDDPAPKAQRRA